MLCFALHCIAGSLWCGAGALKLLLDWLRAEQLHVLEQFEASSLAHLWRYPYQHAELRASTILSYMYEYEYVCTSTCIDMRVLALVSLYTGSYCARTYLCTEISYKPILYEYILVRVE